MNPTVSDVSALPRVEVIRVVPPGFAGPGIELVLVELSLWRRDVGPEDADMDLAGVVRLAELFIAPRSPDKVGAKITPLKTGSVFVSRGDRGFVVSRTGNALILHPTVELLSHSAQVVPVAEVTIDLEALKAAVRGAEA